MSQPSEGTDTGVTVGTRLATATDANPSIPVARPLDYQPPTPRRDWRRELSSHFSVEKLFLYGLFVAAAVVFLTPYLFLATGAFKTQNEIFTPSQILPSALDLSNFKHAFTTTTIARAFVNSSLIAVAHVSLSLFLCSLAGYAFAKYRDAPGNRILFNVVLGTMLIPGAVTTIPVFLILNDLNLMNTFWVMILPGAANAFGIFWMRQYIVTNVPDDLLAAARIDGAGEFNIYWSIVLPVLRPALAALGILVLIGTWNNLMWAFICLRTENMYTLPLVIYLLQGEQNTDYGMLMAAGLLATLPLVIAFLLFQRQFVAGMTAGAVKA